MNGQEPKFGSIEVSASVGKTCILCRIISVAWTENIGVSYKLNFSSQYKSQVLISCYESEFEVETIIQIPIFI